MEERRLRRAGLDYREWARVRIHASLDAYLDANGPARLLAFSTRGTRSYASIDYRDGDALLFGPETRGLPDAVLARLPPAAHLLVLYMEWPLDLDLNESASGPPLGRLPQVVFVVCPAPPNT